MTEAVVGALRANLGLDASAFEVGVSKALSASARLKADLARVAEGHDRLLAAQVRAGKGIGDQASAMQRSVAAFAGIKGATDRAAESARAFAVALDAGDAVKRLRSSLDPAYAAQVRYASQVETVRNAVERGAIAQKEANAVLALAKRQFEAAGAAADDMDLGRLSGGLRRSRVDFQNVAFQVQDFAVQVGAGTSATVALAQQLPQLLGGFGLLGAALGAAAAVALPLAGYFLGAGSAADDAGDAVDVLTGALTDFRTNSDLAATSLIELREQFGAGAEDAQRFARLAAQVDAAQALRALGDALNPFREGIAAAETELRGLFAAETFLARAKASGQETSDQLLLAQENVDLFQESARTAAAALGLLPQQVGALSGALDRLEGASTLEEMRDQSAAVLNLIERLYPGFESLPPAIADAVDQITAINQETMRATASVGTLDLEIVGASSSTQDFVSRWDAVGVAIATARGETSLLARAIATAMAPLEQAQGWLAELGGAAGDFLTSLAATDAATSLAGARDGATAAAALLRQSEGFRSTPYDDGKRDGDGNRVGPPIYRAGYGSNEITLADGTVQEITQGMRVSVEDANRDLARRIGEFQAGIASEIGSDRFSALNPAQQAALTSIAYNYGNLPDAVAAAVREGSDARIAFAIRGLGSDNGGINRGRRNTEASIFLNGVGSEEAALRQETEATQAATEATRERESAARDAARETERNTEAAQRYLGGMTTLAQAERDRTETIKVLTDAAAAGGITQAAAAAGIADAEAKFRAATESSDAFRAALDAAGMSAADMGQAKAQILVGGVDSISNAFGDFVAGGLKDFKSLKDGVLSTFKGMIAQLVATAAKNRILIPVQAAFAGGAGGGGAASGLGNVLGGIGGLAGSFGTGLSSVLGGVTSNGLAGGGAVLSAALGNATSGLAGLATAAGALALPVAGAVAAFRFFTGSTKTLESGIRVSLDGVNASVSEFEKTQRTRFFGLSKKTSTDYDPAAKGIADPIREAYRGIYDSVAGMAGVLGRGEDAVASFTGSLKVNTEGMTAEAAAQAVQAALAGASEDLAKRALVNIEGLRKAGETWTAALTRITEGTATASEAMRLLGYEQLGNSRKDTARGLAFTEALGGAGNAASAVQSYYQGFYSPKEQAEGARSQIDRTLDSAGISDRVPRTEKEFRKLVDRLMESGQTAKAATVIGLAPLWQNLQQLKEEAKGAGAAVVDMTAILEQRRSLEEQIWEATGNTAKLQARALEGLGGDAISVALLKKLWGVEAAKEATEAAQEAAKAIADERGGLMDQLWELTGNQAAIAKKARDAILPANRALYDQVKAQEALKDAADKAREAMERLDPSRFVSFLDFQRAQVRAARQVTAPAMPALTLPTVKLPTAQTQAAETKEQSAKIEDLTNLVRTLLQVSIKTEDNTARTKMAVRSIDRTGVLTRKAS